MCVLLITRLLRGVGMWARKPVNHTSRVAVVTPTDRPKSVRNRCLIEFFCGVVYVVALPFWHFCWYRGFCHRTGSDLLLFVLKSTLIPGCSVERCNKVPRVRVFKVSLFISFEFWLSCVIDSFILRNLFPTITWTSIWLQIYWIANIDNLEFYSLLVDYLLYLHFIFLAFLLKNCLLPLKLHFLLFTLVLQIPNLSQFLTRVGLQSPFVSLIVLTEGFLRYPRAMLGDV